MKHKADSNTVKIRKWLAKSPSNNRNRLRKIMNEQGHREYGLTHVLHAAEFGSFRKDLLKSLAK
jgi:hypothetical protein